MAGLGGGGAGDSLNRGDSYLVPLDPAAGREQAGTRPVLVISPAAFNKATGAPVVLPITTGGGFARRLGFAVEITGMKKTTGIVRCDQPRTLDLEARQGRKMGSLPVAVLADVMAKVATILT